MPLAIARRFGRPLKDSRSILGLTLIALAIAGGVILSRSADPTTPVLAAAKDLRANVAVGGDGLAVVNVSVPLDQQKQLLAAAELSEISTQVPVRPLKAGELLARSAFSPGPRPLQEVAVALPPEASLDSRLGPGDYVDVVATLAKGSADARTLVVARGAEIMAFADGDSDKGPLASMGSRTVVLGAESSEVMGIVFAMHNGEISVVRSAAPVGALPDEVNVESIGSSS